MTALVHLLTEYGIPIEQFGMGTRMPLQALLDQIREGTVAFEERGGQLLRSIWLLSVDIIYNDGSHTWKLHEDRQIHLDQDSREEVRHKKSRRKIDWSVARKVPRGKWTLEEAIGVVERELGFRISPKQLIEEEPKIYYRRSEKFPGFRNHVRAKRWSLTLNSKEYRAGGYVFDDKYLRSYFSWKMVK